jgi:hypothetical protein
VSTEILSAYYRFSGIDSFSFQVTDDHNQSSNIAQVSIIVNPAPGEPSSSTPSEQQPSPSEQTPSSQSVNTVKITLVDRSDRTINDIRLYIKEHPDYATPSTSSKGYNNLKEAFWPDDSPYTDKVDMEISFPDNLFAQGEQFHVCIDKVTAPNENNINIRHLLVGMSTN